MIRWKLEREFVQGCLALLQNLHFHILFHEFINTYLSLLLCYRGGDETEGDEEKKKKRKKHTSLGERLDLLGRDTFTTTGSPGGCGHLGVLFFGGEMGLSEC
jgi:hypothetical protein